MLLIRCNIGSKCCRRGALFSSVQVNFSSLTWYCLLYSVYRKWNERFFMECYAAYKAGRAEKDPSTNWYEGELGFFDVSLLVVPCAYGRKLTGRMNDDSIVFALHLL